MKKSRGEKQESPAEGKVNLASLSKATLVWQLSAAIVSGLLASSAFPPLSWGMLAWVAFIPILATPMPRQIWRRMLVGYVLGYVHFATCLHWLNEVGFGAGWLLALWCALFPMLWYLLLGCLGWFMKEKATAKYPGAGPFFVNRMAYHILFALFAAALWVALELLRGWLLTGFPWDMLGISQYRRPAVVSVAAFTGVYGISFAIMLVNGALAVEAALQLRFLLAPAKREKPWHFALITLALAPICICGSGEENLAPEDAKSLRVVAIQGNIPQCRFWTTEQFNYALEIYKGLTKQAVKDYPDADLIMWPECAVPADVDYFPYKVDLYKLIVDTEKPFLFGALKNVGNPQKDDDVSTFNTAFLYGKDGRMVDYYDKVHRVPFGEYTPLGDSFPWLREMIGMGRDLMPGKEFRVFNALPNGAKAGVNICFEDAFPEISRSFARKGANMLMTITNDSWYNRSCGAEQHASHVVFRAVENRLPFMRSGNNSNTCLVTPDGKILGQIVDPKDGSPFTRGYQAYDIPVYDGWGRTFYTEHGDIFAYACSAFSICILAFLAYLEFMKHKRHEK